VFIIPPKACSTLVDQTRKEMEANGLTDVRPSTSDILTAWFFKVIASLLSFDSDVLTSEGLHRQCTLTERLTQLRFIVRA
jgi:hypothetical protein